MEKMNTQEYFDILGQLDARHGVFYHLWDMGSPFFSESIPTAGVELDESGECLNFIINKDFWESCNEEKKQFILCHECLHVLLNHGHRLFKNAKSNRDFKLMNYATDVVINHTLVNKFFFNRNLVDPENDYCWVDTVFKNTENMPDNKSSEYYYNRADKEMDENGDPVDGDGPATIDEHATYIPDNPDQNQDMNDILEELKEKLSYDQLEDIEEIAMDNESLDSKINEDVDSGGQKAGKSPGDMFQTVEVNRVKKKKKWETVIKKWAKQYMKEKDKEIVQWARNNRRFQMLSNSEMFLPSEMEQEDFSVEEQRVEVWFFQDTSGSCSGYKQRFFDAARTLPENKFDIKMHCFDTSVYETDIESGKLYGFGSTRFQPIEDYIQKNIKKRNVPYPKAVFVITDGFGNRVTPEKPKNWYWFLTPNGSKGYIPNQSHTFQLKDFE